MGKALMVVRESNETGLTTGDEIALLGTTTASATEALARVIASEACTISGLRGAIYQGGSGTNTFQFRKNGVNGNQVGSRVGTGAWADTTNSDSLAANDEFNIAYTDDGTDSVCWCAANIEFSSGHGNIHGSDGPGLILDVDSSTRFLPLSGSINSDGTATEANVQWKNRGYTSWEALQTRVHANARTSTSTFKNRINGADGGFQIDFAAGVTGTVLDTSTASSLADGDLINISVTLGAGAAEDLTVGFFAGTFKSSTYKSETWTGHQNGATRTASATAHYLVPGGAIPNAIGVLTPSESNSRVKVGFAAIVSNLRCYVSANTYTGNCTIKLFKNGSSAITLTISASGTGWQENSSDTVIINDTDELSFEIDEGTANSITIHSIGITFSPSVTYPMLERGTRGLLRGFAPMWR